jgi:hypothetical protein
MTDADRAACREAVKGLYLAANLTPPPDHRIVFVPSPFVMRFAADDVAGFDTAAPRISIWPLRNTATMTEWASPGSSAQKRSAPGNYWTRLSRGPPESIHKSMRWS